MHKDKDQNIEIPKKFRFQNLKIWDLAIEIADFLFDLAYDLGKKRLFKFAEQLREN